MPDLSRRLLDEKTVDGVTFQIYRYEQRRSVVKMIPVPASLSPASPGGGQPAMGSHPHIEQVEVHHVCVKLENSSVVLEPGALQYFKGNIKAELMKHEPGKSWLSRKIASAGTGESPYGVRYTGTGEIWTEPASKHFVIVEMDPKMPMLLDDKAFYACSGKVSVGTKQHTTIGGVLSGNQLVQPKLSGYGLAVVESPVAESELEFIEMTGNDKLVVDGDYMLFYSETLEVTVGPLVQGLINMHRSGEGLVFTMKGEGTVCLMPTSRIA